MAKSSLSTRPHTVNLERGSVAPLLDSADYEALYSAARELPEWTQTSLNTVGECLLQWTADALARTGNDDNLRELARLMQRLQVHKKPESTPTVDVSGAYRVWNSLVSLIDIRLSALDAQRDQSIETRAHVGRLRRAVQSLKSPKRASEIRAELGLSPPRMSQLLALVEEAGFITRKLEGREQWVIPTSRWAESQPQQPQPRSGKQGVVSSERGASAFLKRAA